MKVGRLFRRTNASLLDVFEWFSTVRRCTLCKLERVSQASISSLTQSRKIQFFPTRDATQPKSAKA
jgi:hypothetical protein